jgi:ferric-dicitrate binding protein FerR (iron transport regulator)
MKTNDPLNHQKLENAYRVAYLIAGHIRNTLSHAEREELDAWLEESEKNIELFEELTDEAHIQRALNWHERLEKEVALNRVQKKIAFVPERKRRPIRFLSVSVAAAFVLLGSVAVFFIVQQKHKNSAIPALAVNSTPKQVQPGGNKAILILSDGRKIVLDSTPNGNLAVQGNTRLVKTAGALSYNSEGQVGIVQVPVINTIETPKGGQYQLILSDGTKVWLNAASTLRYASAFTGKERIVELTGEGYFEVTHNAAQPFKVIVGNLTLEDLGTSFNINSYQDEGTIKTTLVEGSVKVIAGKESRVLRPGEQAVAIQGQISIIKAGTQAATGWKEGLFVFNNTPISTVMKDLERWYNIKIAGKESNTRHLNATLERNLPLSKVLHLLEGTGEVRFKWEGGQLIMLP